MTRLTRDEFQDALHKGLGRAVRHIRSAGRFVRLTGHEIMAILLDALRHFRYNVRLVRVCCESLKRQAEKTEILNEILRRPPFH